MFQLQFMIEKSRLDILTLSTTFYNLSVSRNLFSKAEQHMILSKTDGRLIFPKGVFWNPGKFLKIFLWLRFAILWASWAHLAQKRSSLVTAPFWPDIAEWHRDIAPKCSTGGLARPRYPAWVFRRWFFAREFRAPWFDGGFSPRRPQSRDNRLVFLQFRILWVFEKNRKAQVH